MYLSFGCSWQNWASSRCCTWLQVELQSFALHVLPVGVALLWASAATILNAAILTSAPLPSERQNQANVQQMSFANRLLLCPCLLPALPSSCCVSATLPCSPNVSLFSLLSEAARGVVCAHTCARSCRVWERAAWYLNVVHPIGIGSQHALCPSLCWGYLIVHLIRWSLTSSVRWVGLVRSSELQQQITLATSPSGNAAGWVWAGFPSLDGTSVCLPCRPHF